jgi:hypothetical protein
MTAALVHEGDLIRVRAERSDPWRYFTVAEVGDGFFFALDRQHWNGPITLDLDQARALKKSGDLEVRPPRAT